MAEANYSLSPAERMKSTVFTRALQRAKTAVKRELQAKGLKLAQYSCRELTLMAEQYLTQHREELITEAMATVERWTADGFFGKRAQREWFANLVSDAQRANEPKSTTSTVQMLGGK
jgi:hypothetical protein